MQDMSGALDAYLANRHGLRLEQLLTDATGGQRRRLPRGFDIVCDSVGAHVYDDGGASEQYQGMLTVDGISYRFRCSVFIDGGGARFLETLDELSVVRWEVRLAVP